MQKSVSIVVMLWMSLVALAPLCAQNLVDIKQFNPKIHIDCRYGSENNFLGEPVYPSTRIYIDSYVATRLGRVQRDLDKEHGLGLIVYQGYRPPSVQAYIENFYCSTCQEKIKEEIPHYCRGLGVDVGIYYLDGLPLELPCYYGDVSAKAYRDYPYHSAHVYHNSMILEKYMTRHGFVPQRERWWHFDLKGWEDAPNLDLEYEDLLAN